MQPERWNRLKTLFDEALARPAGDRPAFVDDLAGDDASLKTVLASLLSAHRDDGFLEEPAFRITAPDEPLPAPARLGPYEIVREIGQGGMGTVYLALRADAEYEKQVAIKVVRSGLGSDELRRRFRNERQILARLDHPNIAKLLDGGTTPEGVPYVVMDYVEGQPITEYSESRGLSVAGRLRLFRSVCGAVQYAHQNLVVHRDLKPGNILVTADGTPKLLDFGIARLLDSDAPGDLTQTIASLRLMTPDYASPEQMRGEPVTILSDVYSLGVVLYELLTGRRPYRVTSAAPRDIERLFDTEPAAPSTVRPLSRDLDAIVSMAMRREPERRYGSADQLSEDLDRHLRGVPVRARPNTAAYRFRRFAGRHRAAIGVAALLVLSLISGIVATVREARIAEVQRIRAERRFADVRKLSNALLFDIYGAVENLPGAIPARQALVKKALEYLDSLAQESQNDAGLKRDLAAAYQKVGDIQGYPFVANLGDTTGCLASYRTALDIREKLLAADPGNVDLAREANGVRDKIGDVLSQTGDSTGALTQLRSVQAVRQRLAREHPDDLRLGRDLGVSHLKIGDQLSRTGDRPGALENVQSAARIFGAVAAAKPDDMKARRDLGVAHAKVGEMLRQNKDPRAAAQALELAIGDSKAILAKEPANAVARRDLEISLNKLGMCRIDSGDPSGAADAFQEALVIAEALAAPDAKDAQGRIDVAYTKNRLGSAQEAAGRDAAALESFRGAVEIAEILHAKDPKPTLTHSELATGLEGVASILAKRRDPTARPTLERAVAMREELLARDPKDDELKRELAATRARLSALPR